MKMEQNNNTNKEEQTMEIANEFAGWADLGIKNINNKSEPQSKDASEAKHTSL